MVVRPSAKLRFAEATARWRPGPRALGSGFELRGRVEPRENERRTGAWGRQPSGAGRLHPRVAGLYVQPPPGEGLRDPESHQL